MNGKNKINSNIAPGKRKDFIFFAGPRSLSLLSLSLSLRAIGAFAGGVGDSSGEINGFKRASNKARSFSIATRWRRAILQACMEAPVVQIVSS